MSTEINSHSPLALALAQGIMRKERKALSRAITLAESSKQEHRDVAQEIIARIKPAGTTKRLAISGAPGVGKSTFIEAFGSVAAKTHRVAVLAVDPSSRMGGGAILGDKTRMTQLARLDNVYIRPSPSGVSAGGIARGTHAAIALCEGAGFDLIIVETVGVGQAETAVYDVVDLFCLLIAPSGGDQLQGVKRGIMEMADIVIVNKADGQLETAAKKTAQEYRNALTFMRPAYPQWTPQLCALSSLSLDAMPQVMDLALQFFQKRGAAVAERRRAQAQAIFRQELNAAFWDRLTQTPALQKSIHAAQEEIAQGTLTPYQGAQKIIAQFRA